MAGAGGTGGNEGNAEGGAIYTAGSLTIASPSFAGNRVVGAQAGNPGGGGRSIGGNGSPGGTGGTGGASGGPPAVGGKNGLAGLTGQSGGNVSDGQLGQPGMKGTDAGDTIYGPYTTATSTFHVHLDESGLPAGAPHQATFDNQTVTLPFDRDVDANTTHSYLFPSPVPGAPGVRYLTSDAGQTLTVNAAVSDTATYHTQYLLTTQASTGAGIDTRLTPGGWHDANETVILATDPLVAVGTGDRYRFDQWKGDAAGSSPTTTVVMDGPKNVTATYVLQHLVSVAESGLPAGLLWHVTVDGVASPGPYSGWHDDGGALTLSADQNLSDSSGTQYFLQGFSPVVPSTFTAPFSTTAVYQTMGQVLAVALSSGAISGPGAGGLANSYSQQWDAVQAGIAAHNTAQAQGNIRAFICHVQAQADKKLRAAFADTLTADATAVYVQEGGSLPLPHC